MPPSDQTLTAALVSAVRAGDLTQLTLKGVRSAAEKKLGLDPGFFKSDERWNAESKDIVQEEVARLESEEAEEEEEVGDAGKRKRGKGEGGPRKKAKGASGDEDEEEEREATQDGDGDMSDVLDETPKRPSKSAPVKAKAPPAKHDDEEDSEMSDVLDETPKKAKARGKSAPAKSKKGKSTPVNGKDHDESEMSDVLDDTPPRKQRSVSAADVKPKARASKAPKAKAPDAPLDPQVEEIRKLQGQLVKCGIRKVWGRELMHCETSKDKINHLKKMLRDAGMDGRFSEDKARQIKERRELAADLEAVQEGEKKWGMEVDSGDEHEDKPRPRRRLAKGMEAIAAFDDEESD